jgi:ketosteroid isomerase-like protein
MKTVKIFFAILILTNMSCKNNAEKSEASSIQNNNNSDFDIEAATKIVEQRSKEFEDALKIGDSIAVGDIYTLDTKIIGAYSGRDNIVKEVYEMTRDSITGIKFRIINLWGNENIIIEDAYVEFFHSDGTPRGKGECLLVWKKEKDKWRIFRDVYKPEKK